MQEIVINKCYGGFGLSHEGIIRWAELSGKEIEWKEDDGRFRHYYNKGHLDEDEEYVSDTDIARDDPNLVKVVRELGSKADSRFAKLIVIEIPDGVKWTVEEYDGLEWIAEAHRTWG